MRIEPGTQVGSYCSNSGGADGVAPGHWQWTRRQELGIWIYLEDGGEVRWKLFPRMKGGSGPARPESDRPQWEAGEDVSGCSEIHPGSFTHSSIGLGPAVGTDDPLPPPSLTMHAPAQGGLLGLWAPGCGCGVQASQQRSAAASGQPLTGHWPCSHSGSEHSSAQRPGRRGSAGGDRAHPAGCCPSIGRRSGVSR